MPYVPLFLLLAATVLGCGRSEGKAMRSLEVQALQASGSFDRLSNGDFIGSIHDIQAQGDRVYLCDNKTDQVSVVEAWGYSLVRNIGASGEGPGEFLACSGAYPFGDSLYVYDANRRIVQVFDGSGSYARAIRVGYLSNGIVVHPNGSLFASPGNPQFGINEYALTDGALRSQFGSLLRPVAESERQSRLRSQRHVAVLADDTLLAVGASVPVAEVYSAAGELLRRKDLSSHHVFEPHMHQLDATWREHGESATAIFVRDIAVHDDKAYLLVFENREAMNKLLTLRLNDLTPVAYHTLQDTMGEDLSWAITVGVVSATNALLVYDGAQAQVFTYPIPSAD